MKDLMKNRFFLSSSTLTNTRLLTVEPTGEMPYVIERRLVGIYKPPIRFFWSPASACQKNNINLHLHR